MLKNKKLIIENNSELSWIEALDLVQKVIDLGEISNGANGWQYCFVTTFGTRLGKTFVSCGKTKAGTSTFSVTIPSELKN